MSDVPPPERAGWYADAQGAWWWWDGETWSAAPGSTPASATTSSPRDQERGQALLMWILYLVVGGWIGALIFYLISREKPFVRHHAAEALNLSLVLLVPQIVGTALIVPGYIDFIRTSIDDPEGGFTFSGAFWLGVVLLGLLSLLNYALGIAGAVKAHRGAWWRLPIGVHPVRGVLPKGQTPPYEVTEG